MDKTLEFLAIPIMKETANSIFSVWKEDGRFKIYPNGGIYPCQTAEAARTLCHMGYGSDKRLETTFRYFLDSQYSDGGWRCNRFSFGRGPETEYSNPYPTLIALDAFRYSNYLNAEPALDSVGRLFESIERFISCLYCSIITISSALNTPSVAIKVSASDKKAFFSVDASLFKNIPFPPVVSQYFHKKWKLYQMLLLPTWPQKELNWQQIILRFLLFGITGNRIGVSDWLPKQRIFHIGLS